MPKGHGHIWPDRDERRQNEQVEYTPQLRIGELPLLIRRLGVLSTETAALFARIEEALTPIIVDGQPGHRLKGVDEMYVIVAKEKWIREAAKSISTEQSKLRDNLRRRLPASAQNPQDVRVAREVARRTGNEGYTPVGQSPGGFARLELVVGGREVMEDWRAGRSWAINKRVRVPSIGVLTMNLLAPTELLYPRHVLDVAADQIKESIPLGTVIPLGPVVPYSDFFDASGLLLPPHNPPA